MTLSLLLECWGDRLAGNNFMTSQSKRKLKCCPVWLLGQSCLSICVPFFSYTVETIEAAAKKEEELEAKKAAAAEGKISCHVIIIFYNMRIRNIASNHSNILAKAKRAGEKVAKPAESAEDNKAAAAEGRAS